MQEMVGEAKEGALHGPVVLWRGAGWPNQPSHLSEKHRGIQHFDNGQLGSQHYGDQQKHLTEKRAGNQHQNQLFGKQSQHLPPLQGEENCEVVDMEERGDCKDYADDVEWKENQVDMEDDDKEEDFDLGRDTEGERKTETAEIKGGVKEKEDEEANFEDSESDVGFEEAEGDVDFEDDGRVLFAGHFEEGRPQGS